MKMILVSAIALFNPAGEVLLGQRPEGKAMAGLWEFPGGKIEPGETPEAALLREMREEVDILLDSADLYPLTFASFAHSPPQVKEAFHLLMPLFGCHRWQGEPRGMEGQAIRWVPVAELSRYAMPPANLPLVEYVQRWVAERRGNP